MAYIKTIWADDITPISATNLNKIEQGVSNSLPKAEKGVVNGVATLGADAKVLPDQIGWVTTAIASETQRGYLDTQIYVNSYNIWVKKKQFTIPHNGTYRVKFNMQIGGSSSEAYGKVYKNGVAYGTQRFEGSAVATTYTEDLLFNAGDTCEIWVMETDSSANGMYLNWASIHFNLTSSLTYNSPVTNPIGQDF